MRCCRQAHARPQSRLWVKASYGFVLCFWVTVRFSIKAHNSSGYRTFFFFFSNGAYHIQDFESKSLFGHGVRGDGTGFQWLLGVRSARFPLHLAPQLHPTCHRQREIFVIVSRGVDT